MNRSANRTSRAKAIRLSVERPAVFALTLLLACKSADSVINPGPAALDPPDQPDQSAGAVEPIEQAVPVFPGQTLLLPVTIKPPAQDPPAQVDWPQAITVRTDNGRSVTAKMRYLGIQPRKTDPDAIARFDQWEWIGPQLEYLELDPRQARHWSSSSSADPDTKQPDRTVMAIAQIDDPVALGGAVHFGPTRIRLVTVNSNIVDELATALPDVIGKSARWRTPDRFSPWESVRRALYVRKRHPSNAVRDMPPATNPHESLPALYGKQMAGRWITALSDLESIDPGLESALTSRLLCTVWDDADIIAAWPSDPTLLGQLDQILTDRLLRIDDEDEQQWCGRIRIWLDRQPPSLHWIEQDSGQSVTLASANLTDQNLSATAGWSERATQTWSFDLPPGQITRTSVRRPLDQRLDRLIVTCAAHTRSLPLFEPTIQVLPPGLEDRRFQHAWTLADWYAQTPRVVDPRDQLATVLAVQRSPQTQQWQIVVRAALTPPGEGHDAPGFHPFTDFSEWTDLVGHESITIFVGPAQSPLIILSANPAGQWCEWTRSMPITTDALTITSTPDRWITTFTLPERLAQGSTLDVGILRTHAGQPRVDCLPRAVLPWRADPGRRRFDLTVWDRLPTP